MDVSSEIAGGKGGDGRSDGRLADNITHFARALRKAGLKIGPGAVIDAVEAVEAIGIGSREEFYTALQMMLPGTPSVGQKEKSRAGQSRAADALVAEKDRRSAKPEEPEIEFDARFTMSGSEVLRKMDFAQMSAKELAIAKAEIAKIHLPFDEVRTRRFRPSNRPKIFDARQTMRASMKTGGDLLLPKFKQHRTIHPPLVILADISGSMSQYTRIFLHFLHAMTENRRRVHTFLFGTRLTNVTRQMRHKDPDEALDACSAAVTDWSGGTRIGETLREFNRLWARRVLGQGASVLLITDGLERDSIEELETEMDRLHRSCRRLIWLNPLLRFDGFEARARGVRAMLPHVDEFRSVHNLEAIGELVAALSGEGGGRKADPRRYMGRV